MKFLITQILILILGTVAAGQVAEQRKNDLDDQGLKGAVKTVESYTYSRFAVSNSPVPEKDGWALYTFNRNGNLTESVGYEKDGKVSAKMVYSYDGAGRKSTLESFYFPKDKPGPLHDKTVFLYDAKGNLAERRTIDADGTQYGYFGYKYDDRGNLIEETHYRRDGSVMVRLVATFDRKRRLTGHEIYSGSTLEIKQAVSYHADGRKTEVRDDYSHKKVHFKITSQFDKKGREVEKVTVATYPPISYTASETPEPGKIVNIYDDEKKTRETIKYRPHGALVYRVKSLFDSFGNLIQSQQFEPAAPGNDPNLFPEKTDISAERSVYKTRTIVDYDHVGNWTKQVNLFGNGSWEELPEAGRQIRVITYY